MTSNQFIIEIPRKKEINPDVTNFGLRITSGSGVRGFYGTESCLSGRDAFNIAIDGYLYAKEQISGALERSPQLKEFRFVVGRDPRPTDIALKKHCLPELIQPLKNSMKNRYWMIRFP